MTFTFAFQVLFVAVAAWELFVIADKGITRLRRKGSNRKPTLRLKPVKSNIAAAHCAHLIEMSQQPIADFEKALKASKPQI